VKFHYKLFFLLFCFCPITSMAGSYEFSDFTVTSSSVGPIKKGMTISDVMNILPKSQIKKVIGYGEFLEDEYDDFEVYDLLGKHILTITPHGRNNLNSKINRIHILDSRFQTETKLGLGSTYQSIKKNYPILKAQPAMDVIVLSIDEINAWMSIKKNLLTKGWYDQDNNKVNLSKIPPEATTSLFVIWWK